MFWLAGPSQLSGAPPGLALGVDLPRELWAPPEATVPLPLSEVRDRPREFSETPLSSPLRPPEVSSLCDLLFNMSAILSCFAPFFVEALIAEVR